MVLRINGGKYVIAQCSNVVHKRNQGNAIYENNHLYPGDGLARGLLVTPGEKILPGGYNLKISDWRQIIDASVN